MGVVTNYGEGGGATEWEGGGVKFYPYKKAGWKSLSHPEGGHNKFWDSFNTSVNHIEGGGAQKVSTLS